MVAIDFWGDDEFCFAVDGDGEGGTGVESEGWMAVFDGLFDVLGVVVKAPKYEDFFEATGDVEFLVFEESEVARAQKGLVRVIFKGGLEGLFGLFGEVPVAFGDA